MALDLATAFGVYLLVAGRRLPCDSLEGSLMGYHTVYGIGGYNPNLPNNNIIEQTEVPDPPTTNVQEIAEALAKLPTEVLESLRQALHL